MEHLPAGRLRTLPPDLPARAALPRIDYHSFRSNLGVMLILLPAWIGLQLVPFASGVAARNFPGARSVQSALFPLGFGSARADHSAPRRP